MSISVGSSVVFSSDLRYGESVTDALFAPQRQNAPVLRRKRNHPGHSRPAKADARHMAGAMDRVGDAQRPPVIILGPARRIVMDSNRAAVRRDDIDMMGEREILEAKLGRDQRSEEHTSELQSLMRISYAVFCLKK